MLVALASMRFWAMSSKGGSVTPIVLSAVLITLLRAFLTEVLEFSSQREMLLIRTLSMVPL